MVSEHWWQTSLWITGLTRWNPLEKYLWRIHQMRIQTQPLFWNQHQTPHLSLTQNSETEWTIPFYTNSDLIWEKFSVEVQLTHQIFQPDARVMNPFSFVCLWMERKEEICCFVQTTVLVWRALDDVNFFLFVSHKNNTLNSDIDDKSFWNCVLHGFTVHCSFGKWTNKSIFYPTLPIDFKWIGAVRNPRPRLLRSRANIYRNKKIEINKYASQGFIFLFLSK